MPQEGIEMPSAKPDYAEIKVLRKKRNLYYNQQPNHFCKIYLKCVSAIEGGYINLDRAKKLLQFIDSDVFTKNVFPNNILYEVLSHFSNKDEWNDISEGIVLDFISNLYLGEISEVIAIEISNGTTQPLNIEDHPDLIKPPEIDHSVINMLFRKFPFAYNLKKYLYNIPPPEIILKDRFFGFTGDFNNFTRKTCFENVRTFGSVPSDPADYLDYLFVANKLINDDIISRTLSIAIYYRRLFGNPKIFTEDDWELIVEKNKGNYGNS